MYQPSFYAVFLNFFRTHTRIRFSSTGKHRETPKLFTNGYMYVLVIYNYSNQPKYGHPGSAFCHFLLDFRRYSVGLIYQYGQQKIEKNIFFILHIPSQNFHLWARIYFYFTFYDDRVHPDTPEMAKN